MCFRGSVHVVRKFFPAKFFRHENPKCRKLLGTNRFRTGKIQGNAAPLQDVLYLQPPLRHPCPHGGRGLKRFRVYYLHSDLLPVQVTQHYLNRGMAT